MYPAVHALQINPSARTHDGHVCVRPQGTWRQKSSKICSKPVHILNCARYLCIHCLKVHAYVPETKDSHMYAAAFPMMGPSLATEKDTLIAWSRCCPANLTALGGLFETRPLTLPSAWICIQISIAIFRQASKLLLISSVFSARRLW